MTYRPRKRFRSDQHATRAERTAARVRRHRVYAAAVRAGHPIALAAEEARNPMRAFNVLRAEKDALPIAERERLKQAPAAERLSSANLEQVYNDCGKKQVDRKRYLELREAVITEMEIFA